MIAEVLMMMMYYLPIFLLVCFFLCIFSIGLICTLGGIIVICLFAAYGVSCAFRDKIDVSQLFSSAFGEKETQDESSLDRTA